MYRRGCPVFRLIAVLLLGVSLAAHTQESATDTRPPIAPDIREDDTRLKLQRGDFVAVPIPISNPTLDSGLVAGAAYFYAQTEAQQKAQPASVTGIAAMYTSNDSKALGLVQQNYWRENRWRFTGAVGAADVRLTLVSPEESDLGQGVDFRVRGAFLFARLSRRIGGNWYGGGLLRVIDADQDFEIAGNPPDNEPDTGSDTSESTSIPCATGWPNWLAAAWDQNCFGRVSSPAAALLYRRAPRILTPWSVHLTSTWARSEAAAVSPGLSTMAFSMPCFSKNLPDGKS